MEIIDSVAQLFGIEGGQLVIIGVLALVLVAAWAMLRAVVKVALRTFALGCVTILGVILGVYVLFVVLR